MEAARAKPELTSLTLLPGQRIWGMKALSDLFSINEASPLNKNVQYVMLWVCSIAV